MRFFDAFAGVGGFHVGIERAKSNCDCQQEPIGSRDGRKDIQRQRTSPNNNGSRTQSEPKQRCWLCERICIGYSEIDKYAIKVYERNFPNVRNFGDITKINADDLPDFDCLVGGFPCQAFSIAGKRKGFEDTRGTLFFDLARILRAKQPRLFVFENVKGLLSHDSGRTFKTIISTIDELGYDCQWQVLNSKNHGVPQNRERVYIVGHLRGTPRPEVFPITTGNGETSNQVNEKGRIVDLTRREPTNYRERKDGRAGTLDANYYKGLANQERPGVVVGTLRTHKDGNGFREMQSGIAPTLPARAREDGSGQPVIAIPVITPDRVNKRQNGRRFKENEDPAFTVTAQDIHGVFNGVKIRRLTPLECERLQGFPDNWTKEGILNHCEGRSCAAGKQDACLGHFQEMSDTQRYKMCGNAVTVNVVQAVFERLLQTK